MRRFELLNIFLGAAVLALATPGAAQAIEGVTTPASDLRVTLDRLLSEHAFLTVQALHAAATDDDQFAAAAQALEANSAELEASIARIYGDSAGRRFGDLWRGHIGYVVDYSRARRAGDLAAQQRAIDGLDTYQSEFASFLASANPNLSEESLHHLLEDHLSQLLQIEKIHSGDFEGMYAAVGEAHDHMFELGDRLSGAIAMQFSDTLPGREVAFGPAIDLQIALDRLLGEHAFLAVEVMRTADTGPAPQRAAIEALGSNSESLQAAVADIYGEGAGGLFVTIWEEHNGHYVDYVRARMADDEAGMGAARAGLEEFSDLMADYFAGANSLLDARAVREGLAAHTEHLLAQVDAHHAGDYAIAFDIGRQGYRHMGAVSDLLAAGIVNQFTDRFLPDTAGSRAPGTLFFGWLAVVAAIAVSVWLATARARTSG